MTEPLKYIIESLLFVSEEPLSVRHLKTILEEEDNSVIRAALEELTEEFDRRGGGFVLRQVAGGYQFRTRSAYSEWVRKMLKPSPARLSRAAMETLAIIAYKQPIIRADVEHIRGVDCGGVLRMLLEKKLIRVLGRKDIPGRPMIYGTTRQFLEVFNLKDLRDLPSPKEIESLGSDEKEHLVLPDDEVATPLSKGDEPSQEVAKEDDQLLPFDGPKSSTAETDQSTALKDGQLSIEHSMSSNDRASILTPLAENSDSSETLPPEQDASESNLDNGKTS